MNFYEVYKSKHGNVGGKTLTEVIDEIVKYCENAINVGNKLPYRLVITRLSHDIDFRTINVLLQAKGIVAIFEHDKCLNTVIVEIVRFVEVLDRPTPALPHESIKCYDSKDKRNFFSRLWG